MCFHVDFSAEHRKFSIWNIIDGFGAKRAERK